MASFVSNAEWEQGEKFDGSDPILKWKEVQQKTIFSLISIEKMKSSPFESYILHCTDKGGEEYKIFAPSHFVKQIRKNRKTNARAFFCSHGLVQRGTNLIASFEIIYREENKVWNIFDE